MIEPYMNCCTSTDLKSLPIKAIDAETVTSPEAIDRSYPVRQIRTRNPL